MNFCTPSFGTTISTDQATEDGFDVSNLLLGSNQLSNSLLFSSRNSSNLNSSSSNHGFMTVRFVKPPVKIKVEFPVPIEICHIVICPSVSKQSSSAFQLETVITGKAKTPDEKYSLSTHIVAREFINNTSSSSTSTKNHVPNILVFKNPRFQLKPQYHSLPLRQFELYRNFPKAFGLKHSSFFACEKVLSLELTILRVSDSSIPSLGLLQVWGQPSIHCTKIQINKLVETWLEIIKIQQQLRLVPTNSKTTKMTESVIPKNDNDEPLPKRMKIDDVLTVIPELPEEFVDSITCEIMCQPLRLPSGIAIDLTTLERYNAEEARWGRHPNDPFTGQEFDQNRKPLQDTGLKSRIDSFLCQNSDDKRFYNLPRTVGCAPKITDDNNTSGNHAQTHSNSIDVAQNVFTQEAHKAPVICSASTEGDGRSLLNQELDKCFIVDGDGNKNFLFVRSQPKIAQKKTDEDANKNKTRNCINCSISLTSNISNSYSNSNVTATSVSTSIVLFYGTSCAHVIICRPCLIKQDKLHENVCGVCQLKWRVKDLCKCL